MRHLAITAAAFAAVATTLAAADTYGPLGYLVAVAAIAGAVAAVMCGPDEREEAEQ